jgi:hypothetical protein
VSRGPKPSADDPLGLLRDEHRQIAAATAGFGITDDAAYAVDVGAVGIAAAAAARSEAQLRRFQSPEAAKLADRISAQIGRLTLVDRHVDVQKARQVRRREELATDFVPLLTRLDAVRSAPAATAVRSATTLLREMRPVAEAQPHLEQAVALAELRSAQKSNGQRSSTAAGRLARAAWLTLSESLVRQELEPEELHALAEGFREAARGLTICPAEATD